MGYRMNTMITGSNWSWLAAVVLLSSAVRVESQSPPAAPAHQGNSGQSTVRLPAFEEIRESRALLGKLGFWIEPVPVPKDGPRDESLRHALIAFQKVEGRPRTGQLTMTELEALRNAKTPRPLEAGPVHIEVDLYRQILMLIDAGGNVIRILPISTGSGKCFTEGGRTRRAITPIGRFKVIRKIKGWRKSPLGTLYYPLYFYKGTAMHGNPAVPPFPASHGCIRLPMFAAVEFSKLVPEGMPLVIYDSNPNPAPPPAPCPTGVAPAV